MKSTASRLRGNGARLGLLALCAWSVLAFVTSPVNKKRSDDIVAPDAAFFTRSAEFFRTQKRVTAASQHGMLQALLASLDTGVDVAGVAPPGESRKNVAIYRRLGRLIHELKGLGNVLDCGLDKDLLGVDHPKGNFTFALNLYNNADLMPNMIIQLLRTVSGFLPGEAAISVYESGSTDSTQEWLLYFRELLQFLGIRNKIVVQGVQRDKDEERIVFLAKVRNEALKPILEWDRDLSWKTSKVIFLNDVYFCSQHVYRLLRNEGNIVCGLDFVRAVGGLSKSDQKDIMTRDLEHNLGFYHTFATILSSWYWLLKQWRRFLGKRDAVRSHIPFVFYDKWVSHDAMGLHFLNNRPYVQDEYGMDRIRRGLPFPVDACWNGLVIMDAEPFFKGVRARGNLEGECAGSECFLMCQDFIRLGFDQIVVDPGVRLTYDYQDAVDVYVPELVRGIGIVEWKQAQAERPPRRIAQQDVVECCALQKGKNMVDFNKDCYQFDVFQKNFTSLSIATD